MKVKLASLRLVLVLLANMPLLFYSCRTGLGGSTSDRGATSSKTSSITIGAPDPSQFKPELNAKLTGFHLQINPVDLNCQNASKLNYSDFFSRVVIATSLVQGCDYNLILEFGSLGSNGTTLDKVFFSNALTNPSGSLIRKEDIAGKNDINLSITLKITAIGISEGFGKNITTQVTSPTVTPTALVSPTGTPLTIPKIQFSEIQSSAHDACQGCHAEADNESWWTTNAASIATRLQTSNPNTVMPKSGSSQAAEFTQDAKQKMLDFVK